MAHDNVFFDNQGLICAKWTTNSGIYIGDFKRLRDSIRRENPEKWGNGWFLHHDDSSVCNTCFAIFG